MPFYKVPSPTTNVPRSQSGSVTAFVPTGSPAWVARMTGREGGGRVDVTDLIEPPAGFDGVEGGTGEPWSGGGVEGFGDLTEVDRDSELLRQRLEKEVINERLEEDEEHKRLPTYNIPRSGVDPTVTLGRLMTSNKVSMTSLKQSSTKSVIERELEAQQRREQELATMRSSLLSPSSSSSSSSSHALTDPSLSLLSPIDTTSSSADPCYSSPLSPSSHSSYTISTPHQSSESTPHNNHHTSPPSSHNSIRNGGIWKPESGGSSTALSSSPRGDTVSDGGPRYAHAGESRIVRELREQKQREVELKGRWKAMGLEVAEGDDSAETPFTLPQPIREESPRNGHASSGRIKPVVVRSLNFDHASGSHRYNESQRNVSGNETDINKTEPAEVKGIAVPAPLGFHGDNEESCGVRPYLPSHETPIEREIRLTREREHALRLERGLTSSVSEGNIAVSSWSTAGTTTSELSDDHNGFHSEPGFGRPDRTTEPSQGSTDKHVTDRLANESSAVTMKRLANSRLQLEINREKQREQDLKSLGVIHTTSEERTKDWDSKPLRYTDIINRHNAGNNGEGTAAGTVRIAGVGRKLPFSSSSSSKLSSPPDSACSPQGDGIVVNEDIIQPTIGHNTGMMPPTMMMTSTTMSRDHHSISSSTHKSGHPVTSSQGHNGSVGRPSGGNLGQAYPRFEDPVVETGDGVVVDEDIIQPTVAHSTGMMPSMIMMSSSTIARDHHSTSSSAHKSGHPITSSHHSGSSGVRPLGTGTKVYPRFEDPVIEISSGGDMEQGVRDGSGAVGWRRGERGGGTKNSPAEDKIRRELREMQEREQELRRQQRSRDGLDSIDDDDDS